MHLNKNMMSDEILFSYSLLLPLPANAGIFHRAVHVHQIHPFKELPAYQTLPINASVGKNKFL